jgi:hypothetical protein
MGWDGLECADFVSELGEWLYDYNDNIGDNDTLNEQILAFL